MVNKTRCLTPEVQYDFWIRPWPKSTKIRMSVDVPFLIDISEEEAEELETLLREQFELVLSRYFEKQG